MGEKESIMKIDLKIINTNSNSEFKFNIFLIGLIAD